MIGKFPKYDSLVYFSMTGTEKIFLSNTKIEPHESISDIQ